MYVIKISKFVKSSSYNWGSKNRNTIFGTCFIYKFYQVFSIISSWCCITFRVILFGIIMSEFHYHIIARFYIFQNICPSAFINKTFSASPVYSIIFNYNSFFKI